MPFIEKELLMFFDKKAFSFMLKSNKFLQKTYHLPKKFQIDDKICNIKKNMKHENKTF